MLRGQAMPWRLSALLFSSKDGAGIPGASDAPRLGIAEPQSHKPSLKGGPPSIAQFCAQLNLMHSGPHHKPGPALDSGKEAANKTDDDLVMSHRTGHLHRMWGRARKGPEQMGWSVIKAGVTVLGGRPQKTWAVSLGLR